MRTDNVLRMDAMNALLDALGSVETERFISMVKRDTFDYTEWQRKLWSGKTIEEIGYYDPLKNPAVVNIDGEKAKKWIANGAQATETVKSLFKKNNVL